MNTLLVYGLLLGIAWFIALSVYVTWRVIQLMGAIRERRKAIRQRMIEIGGKR